MNPDTLTRPDLWEKAKREIFKLYKTNSAYRSGALVKRKQKLKSKKVLPPFKAK